MSYCTKCGAKVNEGQRFCHACGAELPQDVVPSDRPGAENARRVPLPLVAIVGALAGVAIVLVAVLCLRAPSELPAETTGGQSASEQEVVGQPASEQEVGEQEAGEESADQSSGSQESTMDKVVDAYADVLANADSYFAEIWYGQHPDSDITYTLAEASGDDIPELFLAAHYSNVGSHTSGGIRYIPFTLDEESGTVVEATNDEYAVFAEPWVGINVAASGHSLVAESRYFRGMDSAYFRYIVDGASLMREEIPAEEYDAAGPLSANTPCGDHSLIDALR